MITRRIALGFLAAGTFAMAAPLAAQPQGKVSRVGFLGLTTSKAPVSITRVEAFRVGLRELGYLEGKNISIEFRWADGNYDRLPGLAEELVRAKVDVLVTYSTPGVMAARKATQTIPIVMASVGDPISTGLVRNLARPGGNLTGLAMFTPDEMAKRLELLKDAFPNLRTVAALFNPANVSSQVSARAVQEAARKANLDVHILHAVAVADFEKAFATMVEKQIEALVVYEDPLFTAEARKLVALSLRHRLPAVGQVAFGEAGGLMGYGSNQLELFRRAAGYVDQILKGAKPADLPIQQASRFELVVNLNTASALGVTLPKPLLFRADRTIE